MKKLLLALMLLTAVSAVAAKKAPATKQFRGKTSSITYHYWKRGIHNIKKQGITGTIYELIWGFRDDFSI